MEELDGDVFGVETYDIGNPMTGIDASSEAAHVYKDIGGWFPSLAIVVEGERVVSKNFVTMPKTELSDCTILFTGPDCRFLATTG